MTIGKKSLLTVVAAGSTFGGALGGTVLSSATGNAATGTTTTSTNPSGSSSGAPSGTFVPNETASHEAGERARRVRRTRTRGRCRPSPEPRRQRGVGAYSAFRSISTNRRSPSRSATTRKPARRYARSARSFHAATQSRNRFGVHSETA
jgi:hypothetical protein